MPKAELPAASPCRHMALAGECTRLGSRLSTGGGGGIRTHGNASATTVFETAPIGRSGTPPSIALVVGCVHPQLDKERLHQRFDL